MELIVNQLTLSGGKGVILGYLCGSNVIPTVLMKERSQDSQSQGHREI